MVVEVGNFIKDVLGKLPPDHPDRQFLEGQLRVFTKREAEVAEIDLRQQTYELLPLVRKPSAKEKRALGEKGFVFLPIARKSYAQVVAENPKHFWPNELNYANMRPPLKDFALPVAVEVGLNPTQLALPGSFGKPQAVQLQMIADYSRELEAKFPNVEAKAIMLPVTGYAQADIVYFERTDEVLFRNYFARGLDMLSGVDAAVAGRDGPTGLFDVSEWDARYGNPRIAAVPAVVFLGNK